MREKISATDHAALAILKKTGLDVVEAAQLAHELLQASKGRGSRWKRARECIRLGEEALPDFYIECLEPAEVLRELADDLYTGCPMERGNKLVDLDWDYKYLHGGQ